MNKFAQVIVRAGKKTGLFLKSHAPEILMTVGIGLGVTSTVVAVKQSKKADKVMEEANKDIEEMLNSEDDISETDSKKQIAKCKAQAGIKVVGIYAPAVAIGGAAIACIVCSNQIMRKRIAILATAYATLSTSFHEYRERVIEKYGAEEDQNFFYGIDNEESTVKMVDENGNEVEKTEKKEVVKASKADYQIVFGPGNDYFSDDMRYNKTYIRSVFVSIENERRLSGHIFLNTARERFGVEGTKIGQVYGWTEDMGPIVENFRELKDTNGNTVAFVIDLSSAEYILNTLK